MSEPELIVQEVVLDDEGNGFVIGHCSCCCSIRIYLFDPRRRLGVGFALGADEARRVATALLKQALGPGDSDWGLEDK